MNVQQNKSIFDCFWRWLFIACKIFLLVIVRRLNYKIVRLQFL
jgi:hypothetical protein